MSNKLEGWPRGRALAAKLVFAAFSALKENNRELRSKQVVAEVEKRVVLDEWATERYTKSGVLKWPAILNFYSIQSVKAGYLVKKKGSWYLTQEGEDALELGEAGLIVAAQEAYREWKIERDRNSSDEPTNGFSEEPEELDPSATVDEVQQLAVDGIKEFVALKNAYEFQDLVAALMRGMGYYTPFVAPRGKDGGVDILAYRDPFGIESPRIKVQVKHRQQSASVQEIRQLMGILQKDGDVGIFVSTGGFTPDAKSTAVGSHIHVQLIDLDQFIDLWQDFYGKLSDEDKALLPLTPIYFIAPSD